MIRESNNNYISLQEATEYCSYTQEYLSLRARQGKLKAVKIGRNWITKKEWVKEYIERMKEYNNNLKEKKLAEPPENLPVEEKPSVRITSQQTVPKIRFGFSFALVLALLITGIAFGKESFKSIFNDLDPYVKEISQAGDIIVESTAKILSETISDIPHSFINISGTIDNTFSIIAEKVLKPGQELAAISSPDVLKSTFNIFKEYGQWLKQTFKSGYLTLNYFIEEKLDNASRVVLSGLKSFAQGIKKIPQAIRLFKKEIVIEKPEEEFARKDELEKLQKELKDLKEEGLPVKEIIKEIEVSRITKIEPIKEITKEIKTLDAESLKRIQTILSQQETKVEKLRLTASHGYINLPATLSPSGAVSVTTLGTITTGTWQGTSIEDAYVVDDLTIASTKAGSFSYSGTSPALTVTQSGAGLAALIDNLQMKTGTIATTAGDLTLDSDSGTVQLAAGDSLAVPGTLISNYLPTSTTDSTFVFRPAATNPAYRWLFDGGASYTDTEIMMGDNNDIKYYGYTNKFTGIYLSFSTFGAGYNNSWQYSKGAGIWGSLSVTDGTSNFTANGNIYFAPPSDWATDTVSGTTAYFIRVSTSTNPTTTAISSLNYILPAGYSLATYLGPQDTTPKFYVDYRGNVQVTTLLIAQDLQVSGYVQSHLIPLSPTKTYDLGSGALYWRTAYIDTVTANNLSGTVITGATSSQTWTIDSANAGADRDMSLIFNRGSDTPNAILGWDSANHKFTLNAPLTLSSGIGTAFLTLPGDIDITSGGLKTASTLRLDNAGNLQNIGTFTSLTTLAGTTDQDMISVTQTNNTTGGTQRGIVLTMQGSGVTERGILVSYSGTGSGTTALEISGTWGTGILTNTQAALQLDPYGAVAGNTGEIRFLELAAGGTNYVGFKAPDAITSNVIWTLPSSDGTAGYALTTDGVGGLSWAQAGVNDATYLTLSLHDSLTDERVLTDGINISLTDGGANSTLTIATIGDPAFSTSVTTPLLTTSAGDLTIDPAGNLIVKGSTSDNTTASLNVQDSGGNSLLYVRNDSNVGIGETSPNYKLDVSGDINFTGALREDGNEILSGMIAAFAGSCPTGWTEYTAARGRTIVGTPSGGTNEGTQGTALTNLGTRTITDVPSHYHSVDPPSTSTNTTGAHTHGARISKAAAGGSFADAFKHDASYISGFIGSAGSHSHTVDIAAFNSASTGIASVDVTMPYIQLTYCKKNVGSDLSEWIPASEDISQETIVSIDPDNREKIIASRKAYDPTVIGIIATQPGWLIGEENSDSVQMALAGRVPTRVSLTNGEIQPGDPITTSPIQGVGMKATKSGPIVGKAMEALNETSSLNNYLNPETGVEEKCGTILVFVNISWFNPENSQYQGDTILAKASNDYYELLRFQDDFDEGDLVSLEYGQAPNEYDPDKMETVTYISKTNYNSKTFVGVISNVIGGKGDLLKRERVNNQIISETRLISFGNAKVKISPLSEPIEPGDPLNSSETPGMAKKMTKAGPIIGRALESWTPDSGKDKIISFVDFGWYGVLDQIGSLQVDGDDSLANSEIESQNSELSLLDSFIQKIKQALVSLGLAIENGIAKVRELIAEKITAKKLCLEGDDSETICVGKNQLEELLMKNQIQNINNNSGSSGGSVGSIDGSNNDLGETEETPPDCDATHLNLCTTQAECETAAGFWYKEGCNTEPGAPACQPTEEVCDGIDNDCDELIDEDLGQTTCGVGACVVTIDNCINGQSQTCTPGTPTDEICDQIDNNCDGQIDEGSVCETSPTKQLKE